jgi:hypothetical protein
MSMFADGLGAAAQKALTRPVPKSAGAQMRYLVKQYKGTRAVAQMLRISQRTVERYVKDQIKKPCPGLAARLEREVKRRWQPQIRTKAKAKAKAASTGGIVIDARARMGYTAPIGSTDQAPEAWRRSASRTSSTSSSTSSSRHCCRSRSRSARSPSTRLCIGRTNRPASGACGYAHVSD